MRGSSDNATEWLEEKTRALRGGQPPRVEVFLRSLAPPIGVREQQERLLERLRTFERRGVFESVEVSVWGDAVCPDGCCAETPAGREVLEQARAMKRWAREADADIETTFEEKRVASSVTDERFRKIVLPRVAVGVHAGDDLELVLPCRVGEETLPVESFVDSFERAATVQGVGTTA